MALPTNSGRAKDQGCNPVSSNCVVWQGPDLECIGLCKGDTISDVIAKMATELCTLIDMFDLGEFDFTCLNLTTSDQPDNVGELIQILTERICALEQITPFTPGVPGSNDCPINCIVPIADCFYYTNPQGDVETTMQLTDYVNAIGNKICDILDDITVLQNEVASLQAAQTTTTSDISDIKANKADISGLFYVENAKVNPATPSVYLPEAVRANEVFMLLQSDSLGSPTSWYQNIVKEGSLLDSKDLLFGTGTMSSIPGWTINVQTAAQSLGNLWLAYNDARNAVEYMKENCCSTGCSNLFLNFRASISVSILTVFTDGSTGFTPEWVECSGQSRVKITDELGNSTTFTTSLLAIKDNPGGYSIDLSSTSVDFTTNLTIVADTCFKNTVTETQCEQDYSDEIINSALCPSVLLTTYATSVNYQFTSTSGFSYIVNIYYSGGGTPVASQVISTPTILVFLSILGLSASTNYDFEVIVVDGAGNETVCTKQAFTTLPSDCQPPINSAAIVTI